MYCIFQPAYCFFLLSFGLIILSGVEGQIWDINRVRAEVLNTSNPRSGIRLEHALVVSSAPVGSNITVPWNLSLVYGISKLSAFGREGKWEDARWWKENGRMVFFLC